jgi:hypothetical protein
MPISRDDGGAVSLVPSNNARPQQQNEFGAGMDHYQYPPQFPNNYVPYNNFPMNQGNMAMPVTTYLQDDKDVLVSDPKKRKRTNALPDPTQVRSIFDHEEGLSQLSTQDFQEYITMAGVSRRFSTEERQFLDKIAKKIKNRESARRSRANKKTKFQDLEEAIRSRDKEIEILKSENELLKKENGDLRNRVSYFTSLLNNRNNGQNQNNPQNFYANPFGSQGSTVLFIFLFTFGILWNLDSNLSFFSKSDVNDLSFPNTFMKEMPSPLSVNDVHHSGKYNLLRSDSHEPKKKDLSF